jgi:hypothetical protein
MTLPLSGHQTRAVTFGCMAKGKGVSSRANLLISAKILVGNAVSSGHQAKAVSSSSKLVVKMQIKNDKAIKGLGKIASMTGTARLLQRHPQTTPALGLNITRHP